MILQILAYTFLGISLFIPIVLWAYIFTFIEGSQLSKKRFLWGIGAGAVSVVPILYIDRVSSFLGAMEINIFKNIYVLGDVFSYTSLLLSLIFVMSWILFIPSLRGFFKVKNRKFFILSVVYYGVLLAGILGLFYFLQIIFGIFPSVNIFISEGIYFENYVFNSLKIVIFYYVIVALLEESSKYFYFLGMGNYSSFSLKKGLLGTIFIALGFSFMENILYISSLYGELGGSGELFKVGIFRSIFSTMLHVLCSSVISYGFLSSYLYLQTGKGFTSQIRTSFFHIFLFLVMGIGLHALYDIALTLGFTMMVFIYLVGGYLYVGSLFYGEKI